MNTHHGHSNKNLGRMSTRQSERLSVTDMEQQQEVRLELEKGMQRQKSIVHIPLFNLIWKTIQDN